MATSRPCARTAQAARRPVATTCECSAHYSVAVTPGGPEPGQGALFHLHPCGLLQSQVSWASLGPPSGFQVPANLPFLTPLGTCPPSPSLSPGPPRPLLSQQHGSPHGAQSPCNTTPSHISSYFLQYTLTPPQPHHTPSHTLTPHTLSHPLTPPHFLLLPHSSLVHPLSQHQILSHTCSPPQVLSQPRPLLHVCAHPLAHTLMWLLLRSSCAECLKFKKGPYEKTCSVECKNLTLLQEAPSVNRQCKERDSEGCWMTYTLRQRDGMHSYDIHVEDTRGETPRGGTWPPGLQS